MAKKYTFTSKPASVHIGDNDYEFRYYRVFFRKRLIAGMVQIPAVGDMFEGYLVMLNREEFSLPNDLTVKNFEYLVRHMPAATTLKDALFIIKRWHKGQVANTCYLIAELVRAADEQGMLGNKPWKAATKLVRKGRKKKKSAERKAEHKVA